MEISALSSPTTPNTRPNFHTQSRGVCGRQSHHKSFTRFYIHPLFVFLLAIKTAKGAECRKKYKKETPCACWTQTFVPNFFGARGSVCWLSSANAFSVFHSQSAKELKGEAQKAKQTEAQAAQAQKQQQHSTSTKAFSPYYFEQFHQN